MARDAGHCQRVKFGEVVRLVKDTCKDPVAAGIERVIGLEHLEPGDLRVRSWNSVGDGSTFTTRVRPGQVLFGKRRAYQRKVAVADFDAICSGDIYVFETADAERLLPELLPFICQTEAFFEHAVGTSAGSLSPRTNWSSLADYEFALPPLEEQRRIARLLGALEGQGHAIAEASKALAVVRDALVADCFAFRAPSRHLTLSEVCEDITVGIVVKPAALYVERGTGVPALIMKNVLRGRIDTAELLNIGHAAHREHGKSALRAGDVVAVRSSGSIERTGDAAVVPPTLDGANCIDLLIARPGKRIRSQYLAEFLNAPSTRAELVGRSSGTMQKHLNVGALKKLQIPVLDDSQQVAFLSRVAQLDKAAKSLEQRRSDLARQGLAVRTSMGG